MIIDTKELALSLVSELVLTSLVNTWLSLIQKTECENVGFEVLQRT